MSGRAVVLPEMMKRGVGSIEARRQEKISEENSRSLNFFF